MSPLEVLGHIVVGLTVTPPFPLPLAVGYALMRTVHHIRRVARGLLA